MNKTQLFAGIEREKFTDAKVMSYGGDKLLEAINMKTPQALIEYLEEQLPAFASYKKVEVALKKGNVKGGTRWTDACVWQMEFPDAGEKTNMQTQGVPGMGGFSVKDIMDMQEKNFTAQLALQTQMNDLKVQLHTVDKDERMIDKYMPYIAGLLNINVASLPIQGPPATETKGKKKIYKVAEAEKADKMTLEEKNAAITKLVESLPKKISATDFIVILASIDSNPDMAGLFITLLQATQSIAATKLRTLLLGLIKNPQYADVAINFLNTQPQ